MSGPVSTVDAPPSVVQASTTEPPCVQLTPARESVVGGIRVRRALPYRARRTVGAWCFADHMGPVYVTEARGVDIGPHPHTALQTVTWLLAGEVLHRDSLGSEQVIRPGQLNLMTAGNGMSHSEEATGAYRDRGELHGMQLWIAQPEATRHGEPAFEHHPRLPELERSGGIATVLIGSFSGATSPARHDTPLVGVDLSLRTGSSEWELQPAFEYALIVMDGALQVHGQEVKPGSLAYLGQGRDALSLTARDTTRALLIGGEPFPEPIVMWWNFVARTRAEIESAYQQWQAHDPRFGRVRSPLARIPAPPLAWSNRG